MESISDTIAPLKGVLPLFLIFAPIFLVCFSILILCLEKGNYRLGVLAYKYSKWLQSWEGGHHLLPNRTILLLLTLIVPVLLAPVLVLIIWGSVTAAVVDPALHGITIIFSGTAAAWLAVGLRKWYVMRWQPTAGVFAYLTLAVFFFVANLFLYVELSPSFSYVGTTALFYSVNYLLVVAASYQAAPTLTFERFLEKVIPMGEEGKDGDEAPSREAAVSEVSVATTTRNTTKGDDHAALLTKFTRVILLYIFSLLILVFYASIVTSRSADETNVQWLISTFLVFTDLMIYAIYMVGNNNSRTGMVISCLCTRIALCAPGADYWFIGPSLVYAFLVTVMMIGPVRAFYGANTADEKKSRISRASVMIRKKDGRSMSLQELEAAADLQEMNKKQKVIMGMGVEQFVRVCVNLGMTATLTVVFLIMVSIVSGGHVYAPAVQMWDNAHPQYLLGVVAIITALSIVAAYSLHRSYLVYATQGLLYSPKAFLHTGTHTLAVWILVAAGGFFLFSETHSHIILGMAIFLPIIIVLAVYLTYSWIANDYCFLSHPEDKSHEGASVAGSIPTVRGALTRPSRYSLSNTGSMDLSSRAGSSAGVEGYAPMQEGVAPEENVDAPTDTLAVPPPPPPEETPAPSGISEKRPPPIAVDEKPSRSSLKKKNKKEKKKADTQENPEEPPEASTKRLSLMVNENRKSVKFAGMDSGPSTPTLYPESAESAVTMGDSGGAADAAASEAAPPPPPPKLSESMSPRTEELSMLSGSLDRASGLMKMSVAESSEGDRASRSRALSAEQVAEERAKQGAAVKDLKKANLISPDALLPGARHSKFGLSREASGSNVSSRPAGLSVASVATPTSPGIGLLGEEAARSSLSKQSKSTESKGADVPPPPPPPPEEGGGEDRKVSADETIAIEEGGRPSLATTHRDSNVSAASSGMMVDLTSPRTSDATAATPARDAAKSVAEVIVASDHSLDTYKRRSSSNFANPALQEADLQNPVFHRTWLHRFNRDFFFVAGSLTMFVLILGMGITIGATVSPWWIGLCFAFAPIVLITTMVPIVKLYKREIFDYSVVALLAVSVAALALFSILLSYGIMSQMGSFTLEVVYPALILVLLYISLVLWICGTAWLKRNYGAQTTFTTTCLVSAAVSWYMIVFIIMGAYNFWTGLFLAMGTALFQYLGYTLSLWISLNYRLPVWYSWTLAIVLVILIGIGLAVAVLRGDNFWGLSTSWFITALLLFMGGIYHLKDTPTAKTVYSHRVFPAYKYNVLTRRMHPVAHVVLMVYFGFTMVIVWGMSAVMYQEPLYVGLPAIAAGVVMVSVYTIHILYHTRHRLAQCAEFIDVDVVKKMRERAQVRDNTVFTDEAAVVPGQSIRGASVSSNMNNVTEQNLEGVRPGWSNYWWANFDATTALGERWVKELQRRDDMFEMEMKYMLRYEILVVLAGEYMRQEYERDVTEYLMSCGIPESKHADVSAWPVSTVALVRETLSNRWSMREEQKARLKDEARTIGGRRSLVLASDSVLPLFMAETDIPVVLEWAREEISIAKKSGKKFVDTDFKPERVFDVHANWKRPSEMPGARNAAPVLFNGKDDVTRLRQGSLKDGWLISAMVTVGARVGLRENFLLGEEGLEAGLHVIKVYRDGLWWAVVVDDRLPVGPDGHQAFAHSTDPTEIWPCLLEKAYAKMFGGYDRLERGLPSEATTSLTGASSKSFWHTPTSQAVITGKLWLDMLRWQSYGFYMGAGSELEESQSDHALASQRSRAYRVVDVVEVEGFRMIKLGNPWGHSEWTGRWSQRSSMWMRYPKVRRKLQPFMENHSGYYWMQFEDYLRFFDLTDVVMFTDGHKGMVWQDITHNFIFAAPWNLPECDEDVDFEYSPQLSFCVKRDMEVVVVVEQPERRNSELTSEVGIQILHEKGGHCRLTKASHSKSRLRTGMWGHGTTSFFLEGKGKDPYNIVVTWNMGSSRRSTIEQRRTMFPIKITLKVAQPDISYITVPDETSQSAPVKAIRYD